MGIVRREAGLECRLPTGQSGPKIAGSLKLWDLCWGPAFARRCPWCGHGRLPVLLSRDRAHRHVPNTQMPRSACFRESTQTSQGRGVSGKGPPREHTPSPTSYLNTEGKEKRVTSPVAHTHVLQTRRLTASWVLHWPRLGCDPRTPLM